MMHSLVDRPPPERRAGIEKNVESQGSHLPCGFRRSADQWSKNSVQHATAASRCTYPRFCRPVLSSDQLGLS